MLRITVRENQQTVTMQLEGRLAGPWVGEVQRIWSSLEPTLQSKKLTVDLTGVSRISPEGLRLLAAIYRGSGAAFRTSSLLMEFYTREAMKGMNKNGKEATK
jgi:ABC-type transporter Mla MlaB component